MAEHSHFHFNHQQHNYNMKTYSIAVILHLPFCADAHNHIYVRALSKEAAVVKMHRHAPTYGTLELATGNINVDVQEWKPNGT